MTENVCFHTHRRRDSFPLSFCQVTDPLQDSLLRALKSARLAPQKTLLFAFSIPNMTFSCQVSSLGSNERMINWSKVSSINYLPTITLRGSFQDSGQPSYLHGCKWYLLTVLHTSLSRSLLPESLFHSYKDCLPWLPV